MRRSDFDRRRLRDAYDRNVRRVRAMAEARDGRRLDRDDEITAPRRFVVSEHRSRLEGFGRGGRQVQRSGRGSHGLRFSDKGVYRRGGMNRFEREDDLDRRIRRERFRERRVIVGGLRFGRERLRLRRRERQELRRLREIRDLREIRALRGTVGNQGGGERRGGHFRREHVESDRSRNSQRSRGRSRGYGGNDGGAKVSVTKETLDAELDRFRGGV